MMIFFPWPCCSGHAGHEMPPLLKFDEWIPFWREEEPAKGVGQGTGWMPRKVPSIRPFKLRLCRYLPYHFPSR